MNEKSGSNAMDEVALRLIRKYADDIQPGLGERVALGGARPALPISRPLADIERREPEPLVDGFAHPNQHTILYGPSGSGKGVLAAWKIAARTRAGEPVLVLDYEGHTGEWLARVQDFGGDLRLAHLASPLGLEGGMLKGAIWEQQDALATEAQRVGAMWVYVDSVTAACGVADIADSTAPGPYFEALNRIGKPSVSIGHVTKVEDLKYPFGSMAWRAFVRMAWSFAPPRDAQGQPDTTRRELVNRKTNDYPTQPSVVFDWSWSEEYEAQHVPHDLDFAPLRRSVADRMRDAVTRYMTPDEIVEAVNADGLEPTNRNAVEQALKRGRWDETKGKGLWLADGGRPQRWGPLFLAPVITSRQKAVPEAVPEPSGSDSGTPDRNGTQDAL